MNVLITGGAGFIGYHLSRHHLELGDSVIILDNLSKTQGKMDEDLHTLINKTGIKYLQIDLTALIAGPLPLPSLDVVYHLAGINGTSLFYEIPYQVARTNLLTTLNLLGILESKSVGKLVYASTSEVYAGCEQIGLLKIPTDEEIPVVFPQPTNKRFCYGSSKFMGEFLCFHFGRQFNVPVSVVRYHNVYGPRMGKLHVIPEFIIRIQDRENPFRIYGSQETRSFCYVEDAVKATYLVATTPSCNDEIVHVGNPDDEIRILDLAKLTMEQIGEQLEIVECGGRSGSVSRRCPDTSKLQKLTGFKTKIGLKDGLSRTCNWYLAHLSA